MGFGADRLRSDELRAEVRPQLFGHELPRCQIRGNDKKKAWGLLPIATHVGRVQHEVAGPVLADVEAKDADVARQERGASDLEVAIGILQNSRKAGEIVAALFEVRLDSKLRAPR